MRNVRIKFVAGPGLGSMTLANTAAPLGNNADASVQVRKITDVPDHVGATALIRLWSMTCDLTWLGGNDGRNTFAFSELGEGRIIR